MQLSKIVLNTQYVIDADIDRLDENGQSPPPHHNHFTALFPGHPGEPVPEENCALWCKGRSTEADTNHPAGRHFI